LAGANNYRFSSKERISVQDIYGSELYYYGYRFYQPSLQRWLTRDPIKERGGINLYSYSGNDSMNKVDPFGLSCGPRGGIGDILVPDAPLGFDFSECCQAHDECYGRYGADRLACDNQWLECMQDACVRASGDGCCYVMADAYYAVVRAYGWMFFNPSPFDPGPETFPPGGIPGYELPQFAR
jgi:RHS repeat-associated protein